MSADYLAGHMHRPQSLNRYAYTLDPVNRIDPLGLDDDSIGSDGGTSVTALCDNGKCTGGETIDVSAGINCPPFASCDALQRC